MSAPHLSVTSNQRHDMSATQNGCSQRLEEDFRTAEDLIGAALRGDNPAWPLNAPASLAAAMLDAASHHGAVVLLHETIRPEWNWPQEVHAALRERSLRHAMHELRHGLVVGQLIEVLAQAGVPNLLIKGSALAYTSYANPASRVRADTDLLIAESGLERAHDCLRSLGYTCNDPNWGKRYVYQRSYVMNAQDSSEHCIDLHWRISNSSFLSQRFSFDELYAQAQRVLRLHPLALAHGTIDALLITALHRTSHRYIGGRMIWLYDIHLLAGQLTECDWRVLTARAQQLGLCTALMDSLELAQLHLHTHVPRYVLSGLAGTAHREQVPAYFASSHIGKRRMDLGALRGIGEQIGYIAEMLLPPRSYMLSKYPEARITSLPYLHARRLVGGIGKAVEAFRRRSH